MKLPPVWQKEGLGTRCESGEYRLLVALISRSIVDLIGDKRFRTLKEDDSMPLRVYGVNRRDRIDAWVWLGMDYKTIDFRKAQIPFTAEWVCDMLGLPLLDIRRKVFKEIKKIGDKWQL